MSKKTINLGSNSTGMLAVLFIGLKLTNHIDWSWLWVLAPVWIPVALALLIFVIGAALGGKPVIK